MLQVKEEQEDLLHRRERELSALKGALKEEVETQDIYTSALKEEHEQELQKLLGHLELVKEVPENIPPFALIYHTPVSRHISMLISHFAFALSLRAMLCSARRSSRRRRRAVQLRCN